MDWIKETIEQYDTIIIHRHLHPDADAMGTQLGLKRVLEINYPDKHIYAVGDENTFVFLGQMDVVSDDVYTHALAIVVDVCVERLISDKRFALAKEVIVFDHHLNAPDILCRAYIDSKKIACAEMVADIMHSLDFQFDAYSATCFLAGIVTDSGRFLYPNTLPETFEIAAFLLKQGANLQWIYEQLYTEELNFKKLKGHFINNFRIYEDHIAYMKNKKELTKQFDVSTFTVSRAMVNQMSGIKGIDAWINFTESDQGILVEMRSKEIPIIDIAMKYGGGGHALACGCTLESFETVDAFLVDLHTYLVRSN